MENKKEVGTYPWWQATLANAIDMFIFGMGSLIAFFVWSMSWDNFSSATQWFLALIPFAWTLVIMILFGYLKYKGKRTPGQIITKCPCPNFSLRQIRKKPKSDFFIFNYWYYLHGPKGISWRGIVKTDLGMILGLSGLSLVLFSSKSVCSANALWLLPLVFGFYWFLYYTLTDIFFDATLGELLFKVDRTPKTK